MTHSLYVLDPYGNELELYIDVAGVDWDDPNLLAAPPKPLDL
jgi:catechol-2,3-dioxygenase